MKSKLLVMVSIALILSILTPSRKVSAVTDPGGQPPIPPGWFTNPNHQPNPSLPPGAIPDAGGQSWAIPAETEELAAPGFTTSNGGPDGYGYTWSDTGAFDWIDARSGTNTALGTDYGWNIKLAGYYNLGFTFNFYGQSFNSLAVSTAGAVGFDWGHLYSATTMGIPSSSLPDNFIAVYLAPLMMNSGAYTGQIYYLKGGVAPNRYFVVEWYQVMDQYGGKFTFETIVREDGTIELSYQSMAHGTAIECQTAAGIENEDGSIGLAYKTSACNSMNSSAGKTVRFVHPAPQVYFLIKPVSQGSFTSPDAVQTFNLTLYNRGDLGADTFNLTASTTWPVSFFRADGITALSDSDSDGNPDTGSINMQSTAQIVVKIHTPSTALAGNQNVARITASSHLDVNKTRNVQLITAVPAPFVQALTEYDISSAILYLVQPGGQGVAKSASAPVNTMSPAVIELPNGNLLSAWAGSTCQDMQCTQSIGEIYYTIVNPVGDVVHAVSKLVDRSGSSNMITDWDPVLAVIPNGNIAIAWENFIQQNDSKQVNSNIMLAILSPGGNLVSGPISITKNTTWTNYFQYNMPYYYSPTITGTGDNRFFLAWETYTPTTKGAIDDLYYTVLSTTGSTEKPVTKLTNDTAGDYDGFYSPNVTALQGNRVLLSWDNYAANKDSIVYIVLDNAGILYKRPTVASGSLNAWYVDAVQLSSGKIFVGFTGPDIKTYFSLLDGSSYNLVSGPTILDDLQPVGTGNMPPSVAGDQAGHGIITWSAGNTQTLFYSLVDSAGTIVTPVMGYNSGLPHNGYISFGLNYAGYGITSYHYQPINKVDGRLHEPQVVAGPPGGVVSMPIKVDNIGIKDGTNVTLTATLGTGLTYLSDNSGYPVTTGGGTVSWNLPDLGFLQSSSFTVILGLPGDPVGTSYPIALSLASDGPEQNPADNTANLNAVTGLLNYLPIVSVPFR